MLSYSQRIDVSQKVVPSVAAKREAPLAHSQSNKHMLQQGAFETDKKLIQLERKRLHGKTQPCQASMNSNKRINKLIRKGTQLLYNTFAMIAQNTNPRVTFHEKCYKRAVETDVASSVQIDVEMQHRRKNTNIVATNAESKKASVAFHAKC